MQNVEIVVVWVVKGHSMSPAMLPFHRAHTASSSTLIETMHLSSTVFQITTSKLFVEKSSI